MHLDLNTIYQGHPNDLLVPDYSQTGFDVLGATATETVQEVVVHSFPFNILSGGDPFETESPAIVGIVVALLDINASNSVFWQPLPH